METNSYPEKCTHCLFRQVVCSYLGNKEFDRLYANTIHLTYKRGEHILKQGNRFTHIAYLSEGKVKFNYEDDSARNLILTVVKGPAMLGGVNVFNDDLNMFSVTAIEACEVCLIDISILRNFALSNSAFALKMLDFVSLMFKDSMKNFISLAHKQVHGRIADILIYLSEKVYVSDQFTLSLTRRELAEFAGCSQENVIHTLTRMEKDGIIRSQKRIVEIIDPQRLRLIAKHG